MVGAKIMKYFKEIKTGEVYAYDIEDLEKVRNLTEHSPYIFHEISEKLKNMVELTGDELDLHLNPPHTAESVRADRDDMLIEVDKYVSNPLRWADTSQEDKDAISAYRQLLLDVPDQEGFPLEIEWPDPPKILNILI